MKFLPIKEVKERLKKKKYNIEKEDWFKTYIEYLKSKRNK